MGTNLASETRTSRQHDLAFRLVAGAVAVAAVSVAAVPNAWAEMSADEIRSKVTADYDVTVLKVIPLEGLSGARYAVTVMAPGGDRNDAYQVNTIVLDAGTGKPVIQYGHAGGQQQSAAAAISHRTHPRLVEGN